MPEVLRVDIAPGAVHTLGAPTPTLDPATRQLVDAAVAEAAERAYHEGQAEGRAAAAADAERAAGAITAAIDGVRRELLDQRAEATRAHLDTVRAVATAVLDAAPPTEAMTVLTRIGEALELLDDPTLEVRVYPDVHAVLDATSTLQGVALIADPTIAAGDARIVGLHGGAELTRSALLDAALAAMATDTGEVAP